MNVFMLTSVPLTPPWDQGDKNLAYSLTQAMQDNRFRVLTQRKGPVPRGENLDLMPIYSRRAPRLAEKARVFWHLIQNSNHNDPATEGRNNTPDLYHMVYRPTRWSGYLTRFIPTFRHHPTIHTLPALNLDDDIDPELFHADRLVVLSELGLTVLRGLGFENVVHIPVGINLEEWSSLYTQRSNFKALLDIHSRPVVLYPGHYTPGYGLDLIIQILPELVAQHPDLLLLCACRMRSPGDADRKKKIRRTIEELGLDKNVRLYSTVEDMQALIAASDLTILPLETMRDKLDIPTTLLESLAAQVPVIIPDLAPLDELFPELTDRPPLRQGESIFTHAGMAISPGDSQALGDAILTLLADGGMRGRMGMHGQTLVSKRFDIFKIAAQYQDIYNELTS